MIVTDVTRRGLLKGLGALGCSAAAYPAMTGMTLASAPGDNRMVVIVLRGGLDGIDVVRPLGDPDFAALRPGASQDAHDLDGGFALHAGLGALMPLWTKGELAFAHAVSTPYRDKRSHFDGQDLLEAGTGSAQPDRAVRDGWLNRLLGLMPDVTVQSAFAIGRENMRILEGTAPVANWYPGARLRLGEAAQALLTDLYANDPLFHAAAAEALALTQETEPPEGKARGGSDLAIARFAADRLQKDTRIVSFSVSGWDTHRNQNRTLPRLLPKLADTILTLKAGLGRHWETTTVLAMTEFGRTVRMNGSGGTDHGTGGVMIMAGGAVKGGRVYTQWPGLSEASLYDRRDLMPTADTRAYAGWVIRDLFGIDRSALETTIFPALDLGTDPGVIL